MKQTIKLFALLCLSLIVTLLMASCNDISDIPLGNETTPEATTPTETLSTEPTVPMETTTGTPVETTESPVDETTTEAPAETTTEAPEETTEAPATEIAEPVSVSGYLFSPELPEEFYSERLVQVGAIDYVPELSNVLSSDKSMFSEIYTQYFVERTDEHFVYKVTVAEAGVYEMAIHTQVRDTKQRGVTVTVNEGTENSYTFDIIYQFTTEEEMLAARENDTTKTSYLFGIQITLQAGDNYIRLDECDKASFSAHWRDFYFVKVEE